MKAYILSEDDFERLLAALIEDPIKRHSEGPKDDKERHVFDRAHRFYNYQICNWIDSVKK